MHQNTKEEEEASVGCELTSPSPMEKHLLEQTLTREGSFGPKPPSISIFPSYLFLEAQRARVHKLS